MLTDFSSWDEYYQNDIDNGDEDDDEVDPSELESWFDDVGAPAKTLQYLTSDAFPLSAQRETCTVLDLGTGNGSTLFNLRLEGQYNGPLVGIDYSEQSVQLANRLKSRYGAQLFEVVADSAKPASITFDVFNLITGTPQTTSWWPQKDAGFDLVLDKGTFDAISLSSDRTDDGDGTQRALCEVYPKRIAALIKPNGFLLLTTCNWTEDEIIAWFTVTPSVRGTFVVYDRIKYRSFSFGGHKGQGVATVCFRKVH